MEYVTPESCLKKGNRLQLELVEDVSKALSGSVYSSRIVSLDANGLHVDIPKSEGHALILPSGTRLHVTVIMSEAIFTFATTVVGRENDATKTLCLVSPTQVTRSQRRENFRVPADLHGRVSANGEDIEVRMRDISVGGVSFYCSRELQGNIRFALNLACDEGQDWIFAELLVRRVVCASKEYLIACSFVHLPHKDEDRIAAYLFLRQRRLRQMRPSGSVRREGSHPDNGLR